jgi:hypothetical protein
MATVLEKYIMVMQLLIRPTIKEAALKSISTLRMTRAEMIKSTTPLYKDKSRMLTAL